MQLRYFNKDKLRSPSPEIQQPISKLLIWNFLNNHTKLIILFSKQTRIANFVTIGQIVVSNLEFVHSCWIWWACQNAQKWRYKRAAHHMLSRIPNPEFLLFEKFVKFRNSGLWSWKVLTFHLFQFFWKNEICMYNVHSITILIFTKVLF